MKLGRYDGLLIVDKPGGITSRDAVNAVQKCFPRKTKIGHAGTLDPLATGVLVVGVGQATRLVEYVQRMAKEYLTDVTLGAGSTTDDADGEVIPVTGAEPPPAAEVDAALQAFVGVIRQVPPQFSAAKVGGRRAYALARREQEVTLEPREVQIHRIDTLGYAYPNLSLRVVCGKGTYIRSLARDLGERLGCGGLVRTLRRTRIGRFTAERAVPLDSLQPGEPPGLLPMGEAVSELPRVDISPEQAELLRNGRALALPRLGASPAGLAAGAEVALLRDNDLVGIGRIDAEGTLVMPEKTFQTG